MQHGNVHGEEVYQGNVAQGGGYHGEGYIDNVFSDSINYSDVNLASVNQGSAYHGQTYRGERYLGEVYQRGVADGEEADDEGSEVDSDVAEVDDSWRNRVPGPFLYNRRVILISLPCFVLMVALTGELLLCIVGIGLTMVSVLHTYGEHDRSLVVFMVTFLLAQITVIYTVVPLLWVSLVNLVLIGLINGYAVMTGCWLVVQLPAFRQQARDTLQFVEKALFSLYPGFCVSLWTWTLCFVFIPAKVAPFLLLVFSFVVLQVFLVPAESSFPPGPPSRGEDSQVLDPVLYGLVVSAFCVSPALLHCAVSVFHYTDSSFIQPVIRLCFLLCASVFLTTLLGLRKFIEHIGWSYSVVIKARWVSGLTLAVTTSPVLMGLGASSPLLHWVPVVVAAYICYGIFLSHKQYRMFSSLCAAALILLHIFHVGWLPWKLEYYVPVIGLHISAVHILIVLNAVLCLLCVYVASYGAPEVLGTVISVQTVVFLCSEVLLLLLDLYSPTLTVCTGAVGSYIFIRLYQVKKLPWKPAWFCTSCHMSGIVISFISAINSHLIGSLLAASLSIFPLVSFLLYVLLFEERSNISKEQAYVYIVLAYGVCGLGVHAVGGALWEVTLVAQPCTTDIIGVWVWTSGLLVTFLSQLLFPTLVVTHYWGAFSVLQGAIIIFLLPETSSSWLMLQYWGFVLTVPVFYAMLFCGQITDIKQILAMAFVLVAFPSTVLVTEVYNEEASLFLYVLWILSGIFLASIFLIILKSGFSVVKTERYLLLLYFCELTVTALALLHALVCYGLDWSKRASISLLISTLGLLTLSLAGKLSSFRYRNMPQRLIEEHKLRAGLPLLGNIVCVSSFLMLCVISPYSGFAYDLWLVLSSASFLCLQWDNLLLTKFGSRNQTAPMVVISLIIMMLSAIYNSAFWDLSLSLATVRGFFELLIITVTFPGYMLFTAFLWTGKVLLSEKFIVFVAPLNLALLLLSSSSASIMLGSSGLVISTWLMSFIFTLEKDHPAKR